MWIRMRPDIGWRDLAVAVWFCFKPGHRERAEAIARKTWSSGNDAILTLSLRSAFDLLLRALELPAGSQVLMSAVTISDMAEIVRAHGLVPIGVDIDRFGRVDLVHLQASLSDRVKMVVVAHLFGGSSDMDAVASLVQTHDVFVVEDCAQQFDTMSGRAGHDRSDAVLHSFGPIKTATACGGGVATVKSSQIRSRMREILTSDTIQSRWAFFQRIARFGFLKALGGRVASRWLLRLLELFSSDVDATINQLGRGFTTHNLLNQLRRQPSVPLIRLLTRRWQTYRDVRIVRRIHNGKLLDRLLLIRRPAETNYWVYPVFVDAAEKLLHALRSNGFDATSLHRMTVISPERCPQAKRLMAHVIFLPWYPELPDSSVRRMSMVMSRFSMLSTDASLKTTSQKTPA